MQLEEVIQNIPFLTADAVCVTYLETDKNHATIRWVNDAFVRCFVTDADAVIGKDPAALLHEDYVEDFREATSEMNEAGKTNFTRDTLCLRFNGSSFWASISFFVVHDPVGKGNFGVRVIRDIDDLKNREQSAELALIEHEQLLREIEATQTRLMSAINMTPDPFAIYDAKERLVIWNPAFAENVCEDPSMLKRGMKQEDVVRVAVEAGFMAAGEVEKERWITAFMDDWRRTANSTAHMKIRGRDYKVMRSTAPNGDRVVLRVDISEYLRQRRELEIYAQKLELANQEISQQALFDELTGLGNRRFLKLKLEKMIEARAKHGFEIAALHVDLDRFKQINDTMGHGAGDHVLCVAAGILRNGIRKPDVVARTGGDEFVILMACTEDGDEPNLLAERLIAQIGRPIPFEGRLCRIGASVGIARTPVIHPEELLTSSDIALYKAKEGGRSMLAVFDQADLEQVRIAKRLSDDILRGIEMEEFVPVYEAQIEAATNQLISFEVQARWQHPERGLLKPSEFLFAASEMRVSAQIDSMIFHRAIRDWRSVEPSENAPALSFNVGLERVMHPDLIHDVRDLDYPGIVSLELIETIFLEEDSGEFLDRIRALRQFGLSLGVGDFGSGRASLVGLRRIAPERLTIDERLIRPITDSDSALKLVQSIIDMGRALQIGVTADGVETAAHAALLTDLGCERLQGRHFANAMEFDAARRHLSCKSLLSIS